jgi:SAM-dependent methyltransferase
MGALRQNGYQVVGIDVSEASAQLCAATVASATDLPFVSSRFDCLIGVSIIEHLAAAEAESFIREASRVLTSGGWIFLVTPNYASPLRRIQREGWFGYSDETHVKFYTPRSLGRLLKRHGFRSPRCTFPVNSAELDWPLPRRIREWPPALRRLLNKLLVSSPLAYRRDSFWISGHK